MLQKGPLELVDQPSPGFYSHLFLVQKAMGLETHHRPFNPELVCHPYQVPDGDSGVSLEVDQEGRYDVLCQPQRRLLSDPHSFSFSAIPLVCIGGSDVSVSGSVSACCQLLRCSPESSPWYRSGLFSRGLLSSSIWTTGWLWQSPFPFFSVTAISCYSFVRNWGL